MTMRLGGRFWAWFVAALLVATAAAQGIMLYAATHDPTFAVEPDYYARGVAFDSTMALERRNASLGWRATADFAAVAGGTRLRVRLSDPTGTPVRGANVRAVLVSNLDASHPVSVSLAADDSGGYVATTEVLHRGLWDVQLDARRDTDRFTPVVRAEYTP
jgi:nitrogen fixation protein FixH